MWDLGPEPPPHGDCWQSRGAPLLTPSHRGYQMIGVCLWVSVSKKCSMICLSPHQRLSLCIWMWRFFKAGGPRQDGDSPSHPCLLPHLPAQSPAKPQGPSLKPRLALGEILALTIFENQVVGPLPLPAWQVQGPWPDQRAVSLPTGVGTWAFPLQLCSPARSILLMPV